MEDTSRSNNLMRIYGGYLAEREGADLIVDDHGFISFKISESNGEKLCLVKDFYVEPLFRNRGIGKKLFAEVRNRALLEECNALICWVDFAAKNWPQSLQIIISHGFVPCFTNGQGMQLVMQLNGQRTSPQEGAENGKLTRVTVWNQ